MISGSISFSQRTSSGWPWASSSRHDMRTSVESSPAPGGVTSSTKYCRWRTRTNWLDCGASIVRIFILNRDPFDLVQGYRIRGAVVKFGGLRRLVAGHRPLDGPPTFERAVTRVVMTAYSHACVRVGRRVPSAVAINHRMGFPVGGFVAGQKSGPWLHCGGARAEESRRATGWMWDVGVAERSRRGGDGR